MAVRSVAITTTGTFMIPSNFDSLVSIECLGAGGNGAVNFDSSTGPTGGGGGAYSKSTSITNLVPGQTVYVQVPIPVYYTYVRGGNIGPCWFNSISNSKPVSSTNGVSAESGDEGDPFPPTAGTSGGKSSLCVGDIKYSGGSSLQPSGWTGSSGGGSAGPGGNGGNGGGLNGPSNNYYGNSGGSSAGLTLPGVNASTTTITIAPAGGGNGGPVGDGVNYRNGFTGGIWSTTNLGLIGPGGGGGHWQGVIGGTGGKYGGGGGASFDRNRGFVYTNSGIGGAGVIIFTYNTKEQKVGGFLRMF